MDSLRHSSELAESARLIANLLIPIPESLPYEVFHEFCPPGSEAIPPAEDRRLFDAPAAQVATDSGRPHAPAPPRPQAVSVPGADEEGGESAFVGDQLQALLSKLCRQSGFQSAVVADEQGFPVAVYNPPVAVEVLAAFSSVLGAAIDRAAYFLDQHDANNISLDINYVDKAVVRKFLVGAAPFFLLIICGQEVDERAYIELFSDQLTRLLDR